MCQTRERVVGRLLVELARPQGEAGGDVGQGAAEGDEQGDQQAAAEAAEQDRPGSRGAHHAGRVRGAGEVDRPAPTELVVHGTDRRRCGPGPGDGGAGGALVGDGDRRVGPARHDVADDLLGPQADDDPATVDGAPSLGGLEGGVDPGEQGLEEEEVAGGRVRLGDVGPAAHDDRLRKQGADVLATQVALGGERGRAFGDVAAGPRAAGGRPVGCELVADDAQGGELRVARGDVRLGEPGLEPGGGGVGGAGEHHGGRVVEEVGGVHDRARQLGHHVLGVGLQALAIPIVLLPGHGRRAHDRGHCTEQERTERERQGEAPEPIAEPSGHARVIGATFLALERECPGQGSCGPVVRALPCARQARRGHTRRDGNGAALSAKRESLAERRAAKAAAKKPRTRPVPHPYLLPTVTVR
jgi:hypothetical protein